MTTIAVNITHVLRDNMLANRVGYCLRFYGSQSDR